MFEIVPIVLVPSGGNFKLYNYQREGWERGRWSGKLTCLLRDEQKETFPSGVIIARNVDGEAWLAGDNCNKLIQTQHSKYKSNMYVGSGFHVFLQDIISVIFVLRKSLYN